MGDNHHSQTPTTPTVFQVVKMSNAELASAYAALILADDGIEITADKLNTLIKAANVVDVEPIWASLFAKALEGKDVKDMLLNVGSGGGAAAAPLLPVVLLLLAVLKPPLLLRRRRKKRRRKNQTRTWVSVSSTKRVGFTYCPLFSTTTFPRKEIIHTNIPAINAHLPALCHQ